MKDQKEDEMSKYRVSGTRLRAEVKRYKELEVKALKRYLERLDYELENEIRDGRRDW